MRRMPPRVRSRREAWVGSRQAKAVAAACLLSVVLALLVPGPALAYRCGATQPDGAQTTALAQDCRPEAPPSRPARVKKRGNMSGLAVFVLAVAAVLVIPIWTRGLQFTGDPYNDDPYTHDRPF